MSEYLILAYLVAIALALWFLKPARLAAWARTPGRLYLGLVLWLAFSFVPFWAASQQAEKAAQLAKETRAKLSADAAHAREQASKLATANQTLERRNAELAALLAPAETSKRTVAINTWQTADGTGSYHSEFKATPLRWSRRDDGQYVVSIGDAFTCVVEFDSSGNPGRLGDCRSGALKIQTQLRNLELHCSEGLNGHLFSCQTTQFRGDWERKKADVFQITLSKPSEATAFDLGNRCYELRNSGDLAGARRACEAALGLPATPSTERAVRYSLAKIAQQQGNHDEACLQARKALLLMPEHAATLQLLSEIGCEAAPRAPGP